MVASTWLRAAHRGVPLFFVTALLMGQSRMALAESPAQRQELAAAVRQVQALERLIEASAASTSTEPGLRYHFDYSRLQADLARVRTGLQDYLTPPRAQPRESAELTGQYRQESAPSEQATTCTPAATPAIKRPARAGVRP